MTAQWIEQKREYREYKARIAKLPTSYATAADGVLRYATYLGGLGDATSILSMLNDLTDLFERGAADGVLVHDIVGDDPVDFAEEFLRNYPAGSWIKRERDRLRNAIAAAEAEQARGA